MWDAAAPTAPGSAPIRGATESGRGMGCGLIDSVAMDTSGVVDLVRQFLRWPGRQIARRTWNYG
jgi:hypothetical protein